MSLQRRVVPSPSSFLPTTLWRIAAGMLAVSAFIVVRACGYEFDTITLYLAYLALHVAVPGTVVLRFVLRRPVSVAEALALGVPTGFALEIFTYLGLSALGWKAAYAFVPLGWCALAVGVRYLKQQWPLRVRISAHHAGLFLGLCIAFLATALMAASQMY